jgi:hypothetical protein
MGTKHPMSLNSSNLIKLCNSHCPFILSYAATDLSSTPSPMQTTNHPWIPLPFLTNYTSPTSFQYWPSALRVNVGPQPYTCPTPLWPCTRRTFSPFHFIGPYNCPWSNPQLTPFSSTCSQPPPKVSYPTCEHQFTNRRLIHHQCFCQASNSSNPNPLQPSQFNTSPCPHFACINMDRVSLLGVFGSFHLDFRCLQPYNCIPTIL